MNPCSCLLRTICCVKFFAQQPQDEAGKTGVRLQKILAFFAFLALIGGIFGLPFSLITLCISLGIISLGFFGALYRNRCMLKAYRIIRYIELTFHFLILILSLIALFFIVGFLLSGALDQTPQREYFIDPVYIDEEPVYIPEQGVYAEPMMMMKHAGNTHGGKYHDVPDEPPVYVEGGYEVGYDAPYELPYIGVDPIIDYYHYFGGIYYYYVPYYYAQFSTSQIIAMTIIFTTVFILGLVLSLAYYALVIYTIVLAHRMDSQLAAGQGYCAAAFVQQEMEYEMANNQPFVYIVSDPTSGTPVILHPVDPAYLKA